MMKHLESMGLRGYRIPWASFVSKRMEDVIANMKMIRVQTHQIGGGQRRSDGGRNANRGWCLPHQSTREKARRMRQNAYFTTDPLVTGDGA